MQYAVSVHVSDELWPRVIADSGYDSGAVRFEILVSVQAG